MLNVKTTTPANRKKRAEIVALRSYGVPIKEVAAYIGIDDKTLYKYYKDELE